MALAVPAAAQTPGLPFKNILTKASDQALDKLAKPGAFAADDAIKIGLPGPAKGLGGMMSLAGKAGVGGDLTSSLNDAAGQAASAAKPIFRAAIERMSVQDAMSLGGKTGATDYLRKSAGAEIQAQIAPLVEAALGRTGATQSSQLSALGLNQSTLVNYVSQKTSDGIFTYMGREEGQIRQNPMALFGH